MDIDWTSNIAGDFCLHSNQEPLAGQSSPAPLQCWSAADSGHHQDRVVLTKHYDYWITDSQTNQSMVKATVKIALLKPHRKYPRRRSRSPWSLTSP